MTSQDDIQRQEHLEHQRQLLKEAQRRLRVLELQRVREGYEARPHIITEIETLEAEIKKYESKITELQKPFRTQIVPIDSYQTHEDISSNPALGHRWLWASAVIIIVLLLGFVLWQANNNSNSFSPQIIEKIPLQYQHGAFPQTSDIRAGLKNFALEVSFDVPPDQNFSYTVPIIHFRTIDNPSSYFKLALDQQTMSWLVYSEPPYIKAGDGLIQQNS